MVAKWIFYRLQLVRLALKEFEDCEPSIDALISTTTGSPWQKKEAQTWG
jgi:hypothetical protein